MDEEERNAICHGIIESDKCVTRVVVNGDMLTTDCAFQFGGTCFRLDINKAIELGLLIKEN